MKYIVIQRSSLLPGTAHAYFVDAGTEEDAAELIINHPHEGQIIRGKIVTDTEVFELQSIFK